MDKVKGNKEAGIDVQMNSKSHVQLKVLSPQRTNASDVKRSEPKMHFDELLTHAGELGPYQVLVFLSTMPFYFFGVFAYFSQLLMTVTGTHWCWVPELALADVDERRAAAIPRDERGYAQCLQFVNRSDPGETMPCRHGWEFGSEIPYPTVGSELGWVCDRAAHQATAQAVFFVGSVCGLLSVGWLADRAGRLRAIVAANLLGCLGGIASTFATDLLQFSAARFFVGMSYDNCMMLTYLLVLEYVAPKYRTMISNTAFAVFYTLAAVSLPWIALACGHWKTLSLVTSVPMALAVLAPFVMQESPRWLLSQGRIDEVVKNVETIGRINKKRIPPEVIQQFRGTAAKHEDENWTLLDLLRRPLLRKMFVLICLEHMCCDMIFDASIRSISALDFDYFVSFSLVSFAEFPATMAAAFAMDWMGRRWLISVTMLAASLFLLLTAFIGNGIVSVVCAVIARLFINVSYITAFQWAAELLPTPVRASGVSVIHMFGYIATMMIQYIVYLGTYIVWLPLVISAGVALFGGAVALFLPETMKKEMPQTFDEAEELVRTQRLFEMPCWPRKKVEVIGKDNYSFKEYL